VGFPASDTLGDVNDSGLTDEARMEAFLDSQRETPIDHYGPDDDLLFEPEFDAFLHAYDFLHAHRLFNSS
jgi:hypothetical protein